MSTPCPFSSNALQFSGTPAEQAKCLLRHVLPGGNVGNTPAQLPDALASRIGSPVDVTRAQLSAYIVRKSIAANEIGGSLDKPVSKTPDGKHALYFVIHDTSDELGQNSFPPNIDQASWAPNNLAARHDTANAHVFINRLGQSLTGHDYSVPWRATKREKDFNGALKGLFLHHELVQPRIKGSFSFAAVGPQPGFTDATLDRLALCYVAASVRAGIWLVPAFHCVLDTGIPDGHDDPQNFDLTAWSHAIAGIIDSAQRPATPTAAGAQT